MTGRIIRQTGGFYYVETERGVIECRARGLFRKEKITPLVGDNVEVDMTENGKGYVTAILPRKNSLVRPPVANIDLLLLILSITDPAPNLSIVDKMLAIAEHKDIEAAIVVTKADLADTTSLCETYRKAGYQVVSINSLSDSPDAIKPLIEGKICVLAGNTGVGKSTLLNALDPELMLKTGETSKKLGRGRHTTRVTELFELCGGYIADTPGFSSLETMQLEIIKKDALEFCFKEFEPYIGQCRFTGCSHTKEKGCAVLQALAEGEIAPSRHESYLQMYEEAKQIKDWEV
ncbi:MAG: ribosome small subunit-dependent GTPase A [Oscillospiraceae bacterium]|nr:ribosome small subunit-dependent GTPase A [Oscillospiraceae bacterium]MBP1577463.1 ribosome small subunit-dependent GTPase A [Oscillospiraceae bacterium]